MHSPLLQIARVHGNGKQESAPALIEIVFSPNGNQLGKLSGVRADTGSSAPASSSRLVLPGQALAGENSFELYGYDGFNRMVSANMSGAVTTYAYRPDGLRHSKTTGGVTTTHIWDGSNIALDISGSSVVKYVRGINLLFSDTAGVKAYYLYNGHGDVVNLTSAAGAVTKTYDYDTFGVERNPSAADANPWRYCGEYFDKETGTVYLRARVYDPGTGRFLTADSVVGVSRKMPNGQEIPDPLSLNLYTYCGNNPIMYVDPAGHFWHIVIGALVGAAVGTTLSIAVQLATTGEITLSTTLIAAGSGAASGALAATGAGIVLQVLGNGTIGAVSSASDQYINSGEVDPWAVAVGFTAGMIGGALGGPGANSNHYLGSLSDQLTNRIGNALTYKTGDALIKELRNAIVYYIKSAGSTLNNEVSSIIRSFIPASVVGGVPALDNLIEQITDDLKRESGGGGHGTKTEQNS